MRTLMLMFLIVLSTIGIFVLVAILESIPGRIHTEYLTQVSHVIPLSGNDLETGVVSQIQVHPGVERTIPASGLSLYYPALLGMTNIKLLGMSPADAAYLVDYSGQVITEGRMFEPRTNEIILAGAVARALNLQVGDEIDRTVNEDFYRQVIAPLKVVGIIDRDPSSTDAENPPVRFGFISGEYLDGHELYAPLNHGFVVVPRAGQLADVNIFLESEIDSDKTDTQTIGKTMASVETARFFLFVTFGVVNTLVAVIVALVVAAINRIALMQRLEELGLLNALGFNKPILMRRMVAETSVSSVMGWLLGIFLSVTFMAFLRDDVLYARGIDLHIWNPVPFIFVLPIPLAVIISAMRSIQRIFVSLDSVEILERGKLSEENAKPYASVSRSTSNPLSSITFYLRHRRRGITLVSTMALMIIGVAFPAFLMLTTITAMKPATETFRLISEVYPPQGKSVDAGIAAQIRNNPSVETIIPALKLGVGINVPPGGLIIADIYGVSEQDMTLLMERLGVNLMEGSLPRPRTNEMVISSAVARNRGIKVGDVIGGPANGDVANSDDPPVEMVVTGILGPGVPWVGLASYEFLQSHELTRDTPETLLVIPFAGRERDVSVWLEQNAKTSLTDVRTYENEIKEFNDVMSSISTAFAVIESLIAIVAAIALATLNSIFFNQRREEFGILNAIGRSRPWLIVRTLRETSVTAFIAWLIGALVSLIGLILLQVFVYTPMGLNVDMGNITPWLFTLPIPLAVVIVSVGSIGHMLFKLDPVSIVEMKS
jgi:ABC-type lipoprotein release transport system permease subunit